MDRVKIIFPENSFFQTQYIIGVSDLNYGNHLGNDKLLTLCHEARLRFLKAQGQNEIDFFKRSLIQVDAAISYKCQGHFGDIILIELALGEVTARCFQLLYRLTNQTKNTYLALAKTNLVAFDYQNNCPTHFTEEALEFLNSLS